VHVFKHPSPAADILHETLSRPHLLHTLTSTLENTPEVFQDALNRAFEGHDVPAMHDKLISLVPSISLPSLRDVGRSVDELTDRAQEMMKRRKFVDFVEREMN
jgi:hypothetical protein